MLSPIILNFAPGETLCDVLSVTDIVGVCAGTVTVPCSSLDFSIEKVAPKLANYANSYQDNEYFYDTTFSAPGANKSLYTNPVRKIVDNKAVAGFCIGINDQGLFDKAGKLAVKGMNYILKHIAKECYFRLLRAASGPLLTNSHTTFSGSLNPLLWGVNGQRTYYMDIDELQRLNLNVFILQLSASIIAQGEVNILCVGNFPSIKDEVARMCLHPSWTDRYLPGVPGNPLINLLSTHIYNVCNNTKAMALIPDGSVGVILPGIQVSFIFS